MGKLGLFSKFTIIALFLLNGCSPAYQKISTKPVIEVNDHLMTAKEFSAILARKLKDLDSLSAKDPNFVERTKQQILKDFISQSLTLDYARTQKLILDEHTLDQEVDRIRASYPDDISFRRELALENQSYADWREQLRYHMIEKMVFAKINEKAKPTADEEIKKYYEIRKDFYKRKERISFHQIVLEDEARAEFIKAELKKKSFDDLAKRYSIAPEAKEGGLVGWIEKGSVDYFDQLFNKPIGQIQGPFKSPFGFHLVRIDKKGAPSSPTYEELKPQIVKELQAKAEQAAFVLWLDSQLRASKVLKNTELINSVKIETRSEN